MPELRKDPITHRWVIISTDRAKRPTDFSKSRVEIKGNGVCPFCYGNESKTPPEILAYAKNGRLANGPGWSVRVVPNKFPALGIEGSLDRQGVGLFDKMNGIGAHEVIIETPDHLSTLASVPDEQVEQVLWAYRDRMTDLKNDRRFRYVLVFKNYGEAAGASLEHTHSQLIALAIVPKQVQEEMENAKVYFEEKERCIFCDIVRQEVDDGQRLIAENEHCIALAPYAPRFPFETWVLPKSHSSAFEIEPAEVISSAASMLRNMLRRLDQVLDHPPFNFVLHSSPIGEERIEHYHWHIEMMPTLTKVAGFEWGTGFYINPTPPEESARFLRESPG
ncbi:MAG TPA: galactose-1-phosphate uridylyltransferase [Patescibacteria group bacterium]|nr:galactose-1-phosphate uridylyltransferase [Patescibacteria group bacterium]